jgi:hypothetical protein
VEVEVRGGVEVRLELFLGGEIVKFPIDEKTR